MIISPSFLSADFKKLKNEILSVSHAKWLHFDVMDGQFVRNITYDYETLREVAAYSQQFFDCHLMIENPMLFIEQYIAAGADLVTFHYEADPNRVSLLIDLIHELDADCGISVKPDTDIEVLGPYLAKVDLILVMSVEPGKGGQAFLPSSIDKIEWLDKMRKRHGYKYVIEVDGGINQETFPLVKNAGADIAVVGSYLFKATDRNKLIDELEND